MKLTTLLLFLPFFSFSQKITWTSEKPEWEMRFTLDRRDTSKMEYITKGSKILNGFIVTKTAECLYDTEGERTGDVWDRGHEFYTSDWQKVKETDILIWNELTYIITGGTLEYQKGRGWIWKN